MTRDPVSHTLYPLLRVSLLVHCNVSLICFKVPGFCYAVDPESCCALCCGEPVSLDLQVQPLHMLQWFIHEAGVVGGEGGYLVTLVLDLGGSGLVSLTTFPHRQHPGKLSSPALASSPNVADSKEWGQFRVHILGSSSSALTGPGPALLFCPVEVQDLAQGWISCLLQVARTYFS